MALPEHIDLSNVGEIREQLLSIVNREVLALVVDMSATVSCDHAGSDALVRVYQRALASGTELRLVVASEFVRRVLSINGVDRLISLYPTVETALAATVPSPSAWAVLSSPGTDRTGCRDLLLGVTSRLFNVGLGLQAAARLADAPLAAQLRQAIDELDDIIGEARTAVFPAALDPEGGSLAPPEPSSGAYAPLTSASYKTWMMPV